MVFTTLNTLQWKKFDDYENIRSANPFYLIIGKIDEFIEEKNGSKYLVFDSMELHSTNENKEVLKNTLNFGMRLKMWLKP